MDTVGSAWEFDRRAVDVIAIGSQLVFGSVGNNAASEEFVTAGIRRITVPTVALSNLPHYPSVHVFDVSNDWLEGTLNDLLERGILATVRFITVGFLGAPEQASLIARWFMRVAAQYPQIKLILDPTMGDDDVGVYTAPGLPQAHLEHLVPLAYGIVPNRFELELLAAAAGWPTDNLDVLETAQRLTQLGPRWAVVTSAQNGELDTVSDAVVTSTHTSLQSHPRVTSAAKGAGDHFAAALIMALFRGEDLNRAVAEASRKVAKQLSASSRE